MSLPYYKYKNGDMVTCLADGTILPKAGYLSPEFDNGIWLRRDQTEHIINGLEDDKAYLQQYEVRCKLMLQHIAYLRAENSRLREATTGSFVPAKVYDDMCKAGDNLERILLRHISSYEVGNASNEWRNSKGQTNG